MSYAKTFFDFASPFLTGKPGGLLRQIPKFGYKWQNPTQPDLSKKKTKGINPQMRRMSWYRHCWIWALKQRHWDSLSGSLSFNTCALLPAHWLYPSGSRRAASSRWWMASSLITKGYSLFHKCQNCISLDHVPDLTNCSGKWNSSVPTSQNGVAVPTHRLGGVSVSQAARTEPGGSIQENGML